MVNPAAACQAGEAMLERLLEPGSTERPSCLCGAEMTLVRTQTAQDDTEIRIFQCPRCHHELRLTVWCEPTS